MAKRIIWILVIGLLTLSGCREKQQIETWKVVSEINITCESNGVLTRRTYTNQDKMRLILNNLRTLGQKSKPDVDPESIQGNTFHITLTHTDGSQQVYSTKSDRYIREGHRPWQQADPEKISALTRLLQHLPDDTPSSELRWTLPHLRTLPDFSL